MIAWLIEPLSYQFMQRGMIVAVLVGVACAVVGCYVVLRSMAFIGDAMAHSILPGVAVAYVVKGNLLIGALVAAVAVAFGVGFFSRQGRLKEDSAIGILFAAAFSVGIILISSIRTYAVDLSHILFGNVLGVSTGDLLLTAGLVVLVLLVVFLLYKELLVVSFDPVLAATLRLPAERLRTVLLVLLALTVVVSLQSVGIGLVTSMLVTPGATAFLLSRRLPRMIALSALFGALSSIIGLYASYYLNVVSGAAIVLTATGFFLLAFLFAPRKGLLGKYVLAGARRKRTPGPGPANPASS
jgi:ABC-type Mn2+/Zn2+ transport system permease subunit